MDKELKKLLNNYVNVIYGKAFPINPTTHQLHLLLDYIANLEQQYKKQKNEDKKEIRNLKQLQNNWNELKKWVIEQEQKAWDEVSSTFGYVLNKMQELQGDDKN